MSTKRRRTGQSSSRSGAAREPPPQQQLLLPDYIEKENAAVLDKLPRDVWRKIVGSLREDDHFPFALTCRYFRDLRQNAVAINDIETSRFETVLKSYSYMESVVGDMCFFPTIDDGKYPLLPLTRLCLLSLTTLCLAQPSAREGSLSLLTI